MCSMDVCFHVCFHACAVTVTPGHYTVVRNAVVAMGHCMQLGIEIKWVLYICAFIDSIISTSSVKVQGFGLVSLWTVKKSCDLISAPGSYIKKYCTLLCWISRFITTRGMQYSIEAAGRVEYCHSEGSNEPDIQHSKSAIFVLLYSLHLHTKLLSGL